MTDNGGEQPGNRTSGGDADSWFKPSENRFRTQSDYQDPMDTQEGSEGEAGEETAAVFPDSGGYAGLSASRPALVEPYPDALGAPPTPSAPSAPPTSSAPPENPVPQELPGISYPGAGTGAYRPITRVPSGQGSSWSKPTEAPPVAPEWGARAEPTPAAPPAWEAPEESREAAEPLWERPVEPEPELGPDPALDRAPEPEPAPEVERDFGGAPAWEPRGDEEAAFSTGGYPGIAASAQVPLPPEESESEAWSEPRAWEDHAPRPDERRPEQRGWEDGAPRVDEPWAEPDGARWTDPSPSYLEDRYDDELSPRSENRAAEPHDELSTPSTTAPPAGGDAFGGGTGNTWAFDRDDPRLPDVVRDAERRRRESASEEPTFGGRATEPGWEEPERDSGPDTGELSAAVAVSDDPLAAIANMQSRAKAKENQEPEEETSHREPASDPVEPSWSRGAEGATQMFDAASFQEPAGYGGDARGTAPRDELGFDGREGYGYEEPRGVDQGFETPAYDAPTYDAPAYDSDGYDTHRQDVSDADRYGFHERGHAETGYYDQGLEADGDDRFGDGPVAAGIPSDLGSEPTYGRHGRHRPDDRNEDRGDFDGQEPEVETEESEYDDGFTPADYGMTERPRTARRRRDRITEDFPGFEDRPLGGEAGDAYPGYDSVDFLADTEPGALQTLWLGAASLIPFLGVITALLALFVTGPKAKKAIRESRGTLDGLGMITAGTVFSVVGILVTVISVAIWLIL